MFLVSSRLFVTGAAISSVALGALSAFSSGCAAQVPAVSVRASAVAPPSGGTPLLSEDPFTQLKVSSSADVTAETISVTGQPFTKALRITTLKRPENAYGLQLVGPSLQGVKKGDVLLMTFYVHTVKGKAETGEAQTQFVFERGGEPYTKSATFDVNIPAPQKGWLRVDVPFTAVEDLTAENIRISFRLGYDPQTFEIGGIRLVNYGTAVKVKDLPRLKATYVGQEASAPWRKAAEARIEAIRKGNLTVVVRDSKGKPVKDAAVAVRMKRHAFPFGSAVAADMLLRDDPDAKKYQAVVQKWFNRVVMENDLKWSNYEENPDRAKKGVAWLRERGIEVRGHNLIWPGARWLPKDIEGLKNDKTALAKRIDTHIEEETKAFAGQLVEWDVINEPFANHDIMDILGKDVMVHWFKLARQHDPKAVLFLNDYPPLDGSEVRNAHLNNFYENISFLKEKGAPIGGIGFQGHFGGSMIAPVNLLSGLDRFKVFGLPIAITEFDINTQDEQLQADYTRDFMTAMFSHPSVNSIIMWGFWEGRHWIPDAALFRNDWSMRPNGQAWEDLVMKKWWTNADGKTNASGRYQQRGFLGDYTVTVKANGKTKTVPAKVSKAGTTVTVTLN